MHNRLVDLSFVFFFLPNETVNLKNHESSSVL